jgi:hypothetical protein
VHLPTVSLCRPKSTTTPYQSASRALPGVPPHRLESTTPPLLLEGLPTRHPESSHCPVPEKRPCSTPGPPPSLSPPDLGAGHHGEDGRGVEEVPFCSRCSAAGRHPLLLLPPSLVELPLLRRWTPSPAAPPSASVCGRALTAPPLDEHPQLRYWNPTCVLAACLSQLISDLLSPNCVLAASFHAQSQIVLIISAVTYPIIS